MCRSFYSNFGLRLVGRQIEGWVNGCKIPYHVLSLRDVATASQ